MVVKVRCLLRGAPVGRRTAGYAVGPNAAIAIVGGECICPMRTGRGREEEGEEGQLEGLDVRTLC